MSNYFWTKFGTSGIVQSEQNPGNKSNWLKPLPRGLFFGYNSPYVGFHEGLLRREVLNDCLCYFSCTQNQFAFRWGFRGVVRIFMLYVSVHGMILYIYSLWWLFGFIALFNLMLLFIFSYIDSLRLLCWGRLVLCASWSGCIWKYNVYKLTCFLI